MHWNMEHLDRRQPAGFCGEWRTPAIPLRTRRHTHIVHRIRVHQLVAVHIRRAHPVGAQLTPPISRRPRALLGLDDLRLLCVAEEGNSEATIRLEVIGPRQELVGAGLRAQAFPGTHQSRIVGRFMGRTRAKRGGEEDESENPSYVGLPLVWIAVAAPGSDG